MTGIYFKGNAPTLGLSVFSGVTATVYYLIGATGWGSTYGGLPTSLWDDQYTWTDNGGGTCTITNYTGPGGDITIPDTLNGLTVTVIGDYAFSGNIALTGINIGNSITQISHNAFSECTGLNSVTISDSVTIISDWAFSECTSLTSVIMGNGITSIGKYTFSYCTSLTGITIPDSVTSIGERVFVGCDGLLEITVDALNPAYSSLGGVLFNKPQTTLVQYPQGKIGAYIIPNTVTSIEYAAFSNCTGLTNVIISDSVTSIGGVAFVDCTVLTSITIPENVTSIGEGAFRSCTDLQEIMVNPLNPNYASLDGVLFNKSQTTLIQYPIGKVGNYAIPSTVDGIGDYAFHNCTGLSGTLTIPISVTIIGNVAFYGCSNLANIAIADSITDIGDMAFYGCSSLQDITISANVTHIGYRTFSECVSLVEIAVDPLNPSYASFGGVLLNKSQTTLIQCPGGKTGNYVIPSTVDKIEDFAFYGCASLANVVIGNGVVNIGYWAFAYCDSLSSIAIPASVNSIEAGAFASCDNLLEITVDNANFIYSSIDGVLFRYIERQTEFYYYALVQYPGGRTGSYSIPDNVVIIERDAFRQCTGLTDISISNSVTRIRDFAFAYCDSLTNIAIGNQVTSLDYYAFHGCTDLICVSIPQSVTNIDNRVFSGCTNLASIYFKGNTPTLGLYVFSNVNATVYYIPGATGWGSTFGGLTTAVWPLSVADVDRNGDVNFADFAVFAGAWQASDGQAAYDSRCDISAPFDVIDAADLQVFVDNWLITPCQ